jgi:hypothetical protein
MVNRLAVIAKSHVVRGFEPDPARKSGSAECRSVAASAYRFAGETGQGAGNAIGCDQLFLKLRADRRTILQSADNISLYTNESNY